MRGGFGMEFFEIWEFISRGFGIFIPGIGDFLKSGNFYPGDCGFFKIWGFSSLDCGFLLIRGFLSRGLGIFIPEIFAKSRGYSRNPWDL